MEAAIGIEPMNKRFAVSWELSWSAKNLLVSNPLLIVTGPPSPFHLIK